MTENIEADAIKAIPRSSDRAIRAFMDALIAECPYALADTIKAKATAVDARTLLATAIYEVEYQPSTLAIMADQKALIKKGFLVDTDIPQLTLRNMADHCTKPMLDELAAKVRAQEASLVAVLADPAPTVEESTPSPVRRTVIVNDEMLGRIEIDSETAEVVRVLPDTDAMGEILVDDGRHVIVTSDAETAKQSNVWGSW